MRAASLVAFAPPLALAVSLWTGRDGVVVVAPDEVVVESADAVPVVGLAPAPRSRVVESLGDKSTLVLIRDDRDTRRASKRSAPLAATRTLPVTVTVVDAETGGPIDGAYWASSLETHDGVVFHPSGEAVRVEVPIEHDRLTTSLMIGPSEVAPAERSVWNPEPQFVARDAKSVVATWPIAPEADVFVALTAQGRRVPDDWHVSFSASVGGQWPSPRVEVASGGVRLRGLPFRRRAKWHVGAVARSGELQSRASFEGEMPDALNSLRVMIDLPHPEEETLIGIGGSASSRSLIRCGGKARVKRPGRVRATVRRRNGLPAESADVRLVGVGEVSTDAAGVAEWKGLAAGTYRLELREPGLVPSATTVTVEAGERVDVALREQRGATIHVVVQDERGVGVPFAELRVKQPSEQQWIDLVDGVQRLDPFVDVRGRRVLENVEPGEVDIEAIYADRKGRGAAHVVPGGATRLAITIRHED